MTPLGARALRATTRPLVAVAELLWAASFGAIRDFVWADLRAGNIRLGDFSPATRGLVRVGFGLLFAMVAALLFNDVWRVWFPLLPALVNVGQRGSLLPVALAPATLFLLTVAWSFALTGALHAHWAIRLGVVLVYLLSGLGWMRTSMAVDSAVDLLAWGGLLAVPLFFGLRWRAETRPTLEFAVLLVSVGLTFVLLQADNLARARSLGGPYALNTLVFNVRALSLLIVPLLARVGINIADFTHRAAGWTAQIATERLPAWAPPAVLLLALAWRLRDVGLEVIGRIEESSPQTELLAHLGALSVPLAVALVWWIVVGRRGAAGRVDPAAVVKAVQRRAMPLILAYLFPQMAQFFLGILAIALAIYPVDWVLPAVQQLSGVVGLLGSDQGRLPWQLLIDGLALAAALPLARRGHGGLALYLGIFGLLSLRTELTAPDRPLSFLSAEGPGNLVDFWWTVLVAVLALGWLVRGRLTLARVERLLFLLLLAALLRQTDFIANPFSPVLGFAGVGFIAFGLVWDALTVGAWANGDSPGVPRTSRVFLYLGYVLLTVTVVNWALTVHDVAKLGELTGEVALNGLERFGKPMLYAIAATTLAQPDADRMPEQAPEAVPEGRAAVL